MMTDTPPHVKQKQLEIWLTKPPMERLRTAPEDNEAQFALSRELKKRPETASINLSRVRLAD